MAVAKVEYMTRDEFSELLGFIRTQAEYQVSLVKEEKSQLEIQVFNEFMKTTPAFMFFLPRQIETLYTNIMESLNLQEYVFSLTSVFSTASHMLPFSRVKIIDSIVDSVSSSFSDKETCILSPTIRNGLALRREDLLQLLNDNYWLVTLYFLHFSFRAE